MDSQKLANRDNSEDAAADERSIADFIKALLDRAVAIRQPELFAVRHPDALYWVENRAGLTTVGLRTTSLTEAQLVALLTFRLAQYIMADQLDPALLYRERLEHEPLGNVSSADVHVITGEAVSGELLAYGTYKALDGVSAGVRMRDTDRPLFPVEEVFGTGLFDRLRILPDLPVIRVREDGRLMKSHRHAALDELVARAPVEVLVGIFRLGSGVLLQEFDAFVGDIELSVAKKNQDFFQLPTVVLRGVLPYAPEGSFAFRNYQERARYPYACLCSEISRERLDVIERALELPGASGLAALLALKADARAPASGLEPPGGLPPIAATDVPQQGVPMHKRKRRLEAGGRLRQANIFQGLSTTEAAILSGFMEGCEAIAGQVLLRQGETSDNLYVIESGSVEVVLVRSDGSEVELARLEPDDCFGEIALVTGGERTANVVALEPTTLRRLTRQAYARYLEQLIEVRGAIMETAVSRAHETLRKSRR